MYQAEESRYDKMSYKRCGNSGILLPRVSLGMWQNFGAEKPLPEQKEIISGPLIWELPISIWQTTMAHQILEWAEENFGKIFAEDFKQYREQLLVSTKAGYDFWPGPYGNWGSRKYLMSSLDASLKRMKLDYVDIFYHHRPDPETPLEETMGALSDMVRQGKALYVGISNYQAEEAERAIQILKANGTPCLIHQARYNMFERWPEQGLFDVLTENGTGCIAYSPLAQGALTDRYLHGIPADSRASRQGTTVGKRYMHEDQLAKVAKLNELAKKRGQSLAQMALAWVLRRDEVASVLIGASRVSQLEDNVAALEHLDFDEEELTNESIRFIGKDPGHMIR